MLFAAVGRQHHHRQHVEHRHAHRGHKRREDQRLLAAQGAGQGDAHDHLVGPEGGLGDDRPLAPVPGKQRGRRHAQARGPQDAHHDEAQQPPVQHRQILDGVYVQKQLHRQQHMKAEAVELAIKIVAPPAHPPQAAAQRHHQQQWHNGPPGVQKDTQHGVLLGKIFSASR